MELKSLRLHRGLAAALIAAAAGSFALSQAVGAAFPPAADTATGLEPEMFAVPEGLEVKVWARTPLLFNPTDMDIDAKGRIWVNEGVNYRRHNGRREGGDRVVVIEDTNGDGVADTSHTFVQEPGLIAPLGIAVFDNVVVISQPPEMIVYTDVNRDTVFDPKVDKREVLLSGFNGQNHDHSLHAVVGGPDGLWYWNQGNTGAQFKDKDGKQYNIGSPYKGGGGSFPFDPITFAGKPSDDGHVYVSGFCARMQPDGHHVEIIGHGFRNSYEQCVTSFGDVFQNDNDDPPACRNTWLMEYGFLGFCSRDGQRSWGADKRFNQDTPTAEWRQDDPGSIPAGDVYGGGAPTGITHYENGALGDKFIGTLLSCETGRNVVYGYHPELTGAGFKLARSAFFTSNPKEEFAGSDFIIGKSPAKGAAKKDTTFFRPSDVCIGPDGAIYVCDWYDARTGGHSDMDETCSGTIYRIAPKGFKSVVPKIDLGTIDGAIAALRSPAVNTRWTGFMALKKQGAAALPQVRELLKDPNPFIAARGIWLLPHLGNDGLKAVNELLADKNPQVRIAALRALRRANVDFMAAAETLAGDSNSAVRRDAALAMRDVPWGKSAGVLKKVAAGYDGKDRSYLEALGTGATGKETDLYNALVTGQPQDATKWSEAFARIAWRLMSPAAADAEKARALSAAVSDDLRSLAVDALAFTRDAKAADALIAVTTALPADAALRNNSTYWLGKRTDDEWSDFGMRAKLDAAGLQSVGKHAKLVNITTPAPTPEQMKALDAKAVLALTGDAARGKIAAQRCVICHKVGNQGVDYGPSLVGWGLAQPPEVIAESIIDPSKTIAHGFDGTEIKLKNGVTIQGIVGGSGKVISVRTMGGSEQKIERKEIASEKPLGRSLMLSAAQLGCSAQDAADIVAYLRSGGK